MATPFLRFSAFRLDPQARELFGHDRRIALPVSTIDCLIDLVRHRDRQIGRDELASAVWGRVDVSEVSVGHAIMRGRRVLGDAGNAQRTIRTVPRLGDRSVMEDTREDGVPTTERPSDAPAATQMLPMSGADAVAPATLGRRTRSAIAIGRGRS